MRPLFTKGQRLTAAALNLALAEVEKGAKVIAGPGLSVAQTPAGRLLSLIADVGWLVRARITAAPPPLVPVLPSACRYGVRAAEEAFEMSAVLPKYGRAVEGDDVAIYPARVGDDCALVRVPRGDGAFTVELFIFSERLAVVECPDSGEPGGGTGGGGGGSTVAPAIPPFGFPIEPGPVVGGGGVGEFEGGGFTPAGDP